MHQSRMGLAYGLTEMVISLATVLAPPLAGYLYAIRPSLPYSGNFGLILLSLAILALYNYWPRTRPVPVGERSIQTH